jgi:tetratricopeptide (TPR) repeat protein
MLEYIVSEERDEIFATSLIRLLENCPDEAKWPAIIQATRDSSPLVRAAAASGLSGYPSAESITALVAATADKRRLVRIRAAASLTRHRTAALTQRDRSQVRRATDEYEAYLKCGPDQWSSHYNLGNYYVDLGRLDKALKEFNIASRLQPQSIPPLVNASMLYARLGNNAAAEQKLRDALAVDSENAVVNFNLGLLLAEKNKTEEAERLLLKALENDPQMAAAAYNLAIMVSQRDLVEAVKWCREAVELRPDEPKYIYTLAFYLNQRGKFGESSRLLQTLVRKHPDYIDAYPLLGTALEKQGRTSEARDVYRRALEIGGIAPNTRRQLEAMLARLKR